MDIFDFDNVKAEKANAMLKYRRLRTFTKLFRFLELCLALVFLSYVSTFLSFAVKLSGDYLRRLSSIIVKPVFVFVISNAIILALFFKSGKNPAGDNAEAELYREFVKNKDTQTELRSENQTISDESEEIVYQDKQIMSEVKTNSNTPPKCERDGKEFVTVLSNSDTAEKKNFRRSKSENLMRDGYEKPIRVLRRSETEMCRKIASPGDEESSEEEELFGVDELSNEEFQRTIEAFIEKQVTFHRQERVAVVPHQNQN